jgi:hypothetical protein
MSEPQTENTMIAGLLREREGYARRGLDDRVAQVDEQLRLLGHTSDTSEDQVDQTPGQRVVEPTPDQKEADQKTSLQAAGQKPAEAQRTEAPKGRQPRGSQKA